MAEFDPITGRYLYVDIRGARNRVYFEEAGRGRPLLCLHTAGADSRQYRHLLCDAEVNDRWRTIAFDMPYHGRSMPPEGWWEKEYLLTTDTYAETVMAFIRAMELERPVILGCSMGGAVALELARRHADELEAVVALEAASKIEGRFTDWTVLPDIDGSVAAAAWTYGLMAPQSPEELRREVWWIYAQGGLGVYRGDTYFYSVDWDLREREEEIDTSKCPVYLLTGEYDYACTPQETASTAAAIPDAKNLTMKDIGHFPMAENYPHFKEYLLPVLHELSSTSHRRNPDRRIMATQEEKQAYIDGMAEERGYVLDYHKVMAAHDFDTLQAANGLVEAAYLKQRRLDRKTKELLFIVSLTVMRASKGHIASHIKVALNLGLSKEEILEAIEISLPEAGVVAFQQGFDAWREVTEAEGIEPTVDVFEGGSGSDG